MSKPKTHHLCKSYTLVITVINIVLGLGSNLGDRRQNLRRAIDALGGQLSITKISSVYETAPWGVTDQAHFLNLCLSAQTDLSPHDLLATIKGVEVNLGRVPNTHWGPRKIDIDLLDYGNQILDSDTLTLPHAQIAERAFVCVPFAEIAPNWIHPVSDKPINLLVSDLDTSDVVKSESAQTLTQPFVWNRTYVMGILNVTPDSFSGDGISEAGVSSALAQAKQFVEWGADIIDIGGESTKPGGDAVTASIEQSRVLPIISALKTEISVPISIDTYRASTAKLALEAGANWVNDIWGMKYDDQMGSVVAETDCPVVLMHNGRNRKVEDRDDQTGGYYGYTHYDDVVQETCAELMECVKIAQSAGVADHQIILDPGIGFGKTGPQNIEILNRLDEVKALGFPVLLGTSRKGFIGHTLGGLPAHERTEGTAATIAIGIQRGADIVRVHDVKEMARVAKMTDAILKG